MKKWIIISVVVLAILGTVCGLVWQQKRHTVSDFSVFPCEFRMTDTIVVDSSAEKYTLKRQSGTWHVAEPINEALDAFAASDLDRFLASKVFVDEKREVTEDEKARLRHERPTHVTFSGAGQNLCTLELGRGYKLPTVDSERRWVFMDGDAHAWRTFVPLMDYAQLFEQPLVNWRHRMLLEIPSHEMTGLEIWTIAESYHLQADAPKTKDNPRGWRVSAATRNRQNVSCDFEIDARRVATIVELVTPFMVDDWADKLPPEELDKFYFAGRLTVETSSGKHVIQIGPEIDFKRHPEWARHGEGARFVSLKGDSRVGIMSARRLLGILPSLDDMRTKRVWSVDSTRFAGIDIWSGTTCLRYAPTAPNVWAGMPCTPPGTDSDPSVKPVPIDNAELGMFAKALNKLEAVRYATEEEREWVPALATEPEARILIYEDVIGTPAYALHLSAPVNNMYRYALTQTRGADGKMVSGAVFLMTESLARFLLGDLTKAP